MPDQLDLERELVALGRALAPTRPEDDLVDDRPRPHRGAGGATPPRRVGASSRRPTGVAGSAWASRPSSCSCSLSSRRSGPLSSSSSGSAASSCEESPPTGAPSMTPPTASTGTAQERPGA